MNSVTISCNPMVNWPCQKDVASAQEIIKICMLRTDRRISISELCCDANMHQVSSLMKTFGLLCDDSLGNLKITERGEHIHYNGWQS